MAYDGRDERGTDHTEDPWRGTAYDGENWVGMRGRRGPVSAGRTVGWWWVRIWCRRVVGGCQMR